MHGQLDGFLSAQGALVLGSALRAVDEAAAPDLAHGAAVAPPGGGNGVADAHGALVGWFGPAGTAGPCARDGMRDDAHGAAVPLPPPGNPVVAHGAAVPPDSARGSLSAGCGLAVGALDLGCEEV